VAISCAWTPGASKNLWSATGDRLYYCQGSKHITNSAAIVCMYASVSLHKFNGQSGRKCTTEYVTLRLINDCWIHTPPAARLPTATLPITDFLTAHQWHTKTLLALKFFLYIRTVWVHRQMLLALSKLTKVGPSQKHLSNTDVTHCTYFRRYKQEAAHC
jgi:hypothetical protein